MIAGLTWLLCFQLVGEVVVRVTHLPVPGPVLGMLLCFGWLQWRSVGDDHRLVRAGEGLLRHLQLLFVPAGVGVVAALGVIGDNALPIAAAMVGSWLAGLVVIGWTATALDRLVQR